MGINFLEKGEVLAIFPEGTRSKDGKLGKIESGALMMAGKTRSTIVPAFITGTDFKRQGKLFPKITVRFGKPIIFEDNVPVDKELLINMTDRLIEELHKLEKTE